MFDGLKLFFFFWLIMWRYIAGVSPPVVKRKQNPEERRVYFKAYENQQRKRRKEEVIQEWQATRPWLKDTENGLVCTFCIDYGKDRTCVYVTGCKAYKLDSVNKHERCKQHKKNLLIAQAKSQDPSESQAGKIVSKLNADIIDKLDKMFRNCHALVVKNRPLSDFDWLCKLDDKKGLNLGSTYRNTEAAKDFIKSIANVQFDKVSTQIQESKFLCFIGDGSTDSSIKEQEMWFVRSCMKGQISVNFIGVHAAEKADAKGIVNGLKETVSKNLELDWVDVSQKTVALSCDGASVMTGARAGVGALLRNEQPCLLTIHCMAHRLELALKDSSKQLKLYDKTINVLAMGMYYFYHNSGLNRAMLVRSFNAIAVNGKEELMMPTRVGGTRWIGHTQRALTNLTKSYRYIVQHLGQLSEPTERVSVDSKSKAVAFLKLLKSKDVLCFMFFMMDVLSPLRRLSLLLQERTCVIGRQHAEISTTLEVIRKLKDNDGPHLRKVADLDVFEGNQLTHCNAAEFQSARKKLLVEIETALERRFADFSSPNVILSTKIADIQTWPVTWEQLKGYGDEDLCVFLNHYKTILEEAGIDVAEAELEWTSLKKILYEENLQQKKDCEWADVNKQRGDQYPNILPIMDLILTLSPSSSEAERGFSQLKHIKSNLRSRLSQSALNHCMGIKLSAPDIQTFDPLPAINYWNSSGVRSRRPMYKDKATSKHVHTLEMQTPPVVSSEELAVVDVQETDNVETTDDEGQEEVTAAEGYIPVNDYGQKEDFDSDVDSDLDEDNVFHKLLDFDSMRGM